MAAILWIYVIIYTRRGIFVISRLPTDPWVCWWLMQRGMMGDSLMLLGTGKFLCRQVLNLTWMWMSQCSKNGWDWINFLFMKHSNELALWDWIRQVSKCNFRRLRFSVYAAIYFVLNNSSTRVAFCFQVGFKKLLWVNYLGSVFQVIQCYFVCFNCAIQSSCPQASVVKVQSVFHKTGQAVAEGHTSSLLCFKMAKASSSSVKLTLREINKFC